MITLSLQPTIYSSIIEEMRSSNPWGAPRGIFYTLGGNIVPYAPKPTVIQIETDKINEIIEIEIVKQVSALDVGIDPRKNQSILTVVSPASSFAVSVQLGRGKNFIRATVLNSPEDTAYLIVQATTIVTLFEAFARVLYTESFRIINEQKSAITSKLATRLLEPFISFQDLLPDIQSIQILSTRLIARSTIHAVGSDNGVTDIISALALSTPVYHSMDKETMDLYPSLDPWTNNGSQFGGKEAHVWIPNIGITSWLAFLGYISNQPDLFDIVSVSEEEVVFYYQGDLQRHRFNFDIYGTDFLTSLARAECFKSIYISILMHTEMAILICAASYTFDLCITEESPIGLSRVHFDSTIPFDSGYPFDSDVVDPFSDGWVGWSLTGRFEFDYPENHCLDTFVMPSTSYTGERCCYQSYYTQVIENQRYDIDIMLPILASGSLT